MNLLYRLQGSDGMRIHQVRQHYEDPLFEQFGGSTNHGLGSRPDSVNDDCTFLWETAKFDLPRIRNPLTDRHETWNI